MPFVQFVLPLLLASGVQDRPSASASVGDWKVRLSSAIASAVSRNPELISIEARIAAARARVTQADALPDPELEIGLKDVPIADPSLSRSDFTMEMIAGRQTFPGAGKRAARRASEEAAADSAVALHNLDAISVAAEVTDAFFTLAELDRRLEILDRSRERLRQASASAMERYRVGKGAQSDVMRANLETTAIEDRLLALRGDRRAAAARLNALQNLPADASVPPIGPVTPAPPPRGAGDIAKEAEASSPAVVAALANVRRGEEGVRLAKLESRPDWTASAYYARRERFEDLGGASISFNLPFIQRGRIEARRAEAEAELSSARADLEAVRSQLRRSIEEAAAELERNTEQEKLFQTAILPQAEITFRSAQEAYAVGQIDFETFVRAALDLDNYESELATRISGVGRGLAALQKASGLPLIEGTLGLGVSHEAN